MKHTIFKSYLVYLVTYLKVALALACLVFGQLASAGAPSCQDILLTPASLQGLLPNGRINLQVFPRRLQVYQHASSDFDSFLDFNHVEISDGRFQPSREVNMGWSVSPHAKGSTYRVQQNYALKQYMERLKYSPQKIRDLHEIPAGMDPNLIIDLSMYREVPGNVVAQSLDWKEDPVRMTEEHVALNPSDDNGDTVFVKSAGIRIASGQKFDPQTGKVILARMPWQETPKWKELNFDRSKYRFVSEWKRAAQATDAEIEPILAAATAVEYQRLMAMGGRLDDGWVALQSRHKALTRYYTKQFGHRFYGDQNPADADAEDAVFLVPLKEMFEMFPLRQHLSRVNQLVTASNGILTDDQALDLISDINLLGHDELSLRLSDGSFQGSPIVMRDVSEKGRGLTLWNTLAEFHIPEEMRAGFFPIVENFPSHYAGLNTGQYHDAGHSSTLSLMGKMNAVEISNLDGRIAKQDPRYVLRALVGSAAYYANRLYRFNRSDKAVQYALQFIQQNKIQFAIVSRDPLVIQQALALQPTNIFGSLDDDAKPENTANNAMQMQSIQGMKAQNPGSPVNKSVQFSPSQKPLVFVFSLQSILKNRASDPHFFDQQAVQSTSTNHWRSDFLLHIGDYF